MRGRSLPNQLILLDECQNLNLHEIKTVLTRLGEGSKIVLMGDHDQIDAKYLDKNNNGLALASIKLKGSPMVGVMALPKGERSDLASYAAAKL
jgi:PhoH-like ATPase